jgi:hypothetical protein
MKETNTNTKLSPETLATIETALMRRLDNLKQDVKVNNEQLNKSTTDENKEYWQNSLNFWNERVEQTYKALEEFRNTFYGH